MELFSLDAIAYNQYVGTVKGNGFISYDKARKKLTRNLLLSVPIENKDENFYGKWFAYGRMRILLDTRYNSIVCVLNNQPLHEDWCENNIIKDMLNSLLKID